MTLPKVTSGSGNIFDDLGLPDAEELHAKSVLIIQVKRLIKERGLTQVQAAKLLGVDQADVSNLINGKLRSISLERLTGFMNKLGQDIEIIWHDKTGERARTIAHEQPKEVVAASTE